MTAFDFEILDWCIRIILGTTGILIFKELVMEKIWEFVTKED